MRTFDWRWVLLAGMLLGCGPDGAQVSPDRVSLSAIEEGRLVVTGAPGAIVGGGVTTVTLTVVRAQAAALRVAHQAGHMGVASGYAAVAPDGSFSATSLGSSDRPVRSGDELILTPQGGTAQAGVAVTMPVP